MEEEENLVQDNIFTWAKIIRQTMLIDKNTERRRLEREKDDVEELIREHFSNSSAEWESNIDKISLR